MNKILLTILILFFAFGCAKDGQDGKAYLSFTWDWYVDAYTDNNPGVPNTIREYKDYEVKAGTYHFEYLCSEPSGDFWGYKGSYRININKGNPAELFKDGENGKDNYYRMSLSGNGPNFLLMKESAKEKLESLHKSEYNILNFKMIFVGQIKKDIQYSNTGTLTVTWQKFILEKID